MACVSDSGGFFFFRFLSTSGCLPENLSLNYELKGSCPVKIGCVEAEIRNLKEDLHTNIFLLLFNRKSGTVHHYFTVHSRCHTVGAVSLERLNGFECNLHQIDRH